MKKICLLLVLFTCISFAQDVNITNGTFNRCSPSKFYDSGGSVGTYSNDEDFVTTICSSDPDQFVILDFIAFNTELDLDILTIYDGDDTNASVLGTFSGTNIPGTIAASIANSTGCLTIKFVSNSNETSSGWEADISCASPCQTITPFIDSAIPEISSSGSIQATVGELITFNGSAIFSEDSTGATYEWDFGDSNTSIGNTVTNAYTATGNYTVTLNVADGNPIGCSETTTIPVFIVDQNIFVDQSTYTVEELIEKVLINSDCAQISNITFSTGTDFGEDNGIGYFTSDGSSFPFSDGILLTSGDASKARGPNNADLSEGSANWSGDDDLDAVVGIVSNNASVIEFDFVPLADNISFDFLMASEEYNMGLFECDYSDAFAFLLTDAAGNTTNLAVLPGTTTPILVTNIHPDNGFCPAVNEQYFGEYTGVNRPPMSFDGRTAVFTAQSAVVPGETYRIKLVIADASDAASDSGVFLRAGSFNLGGDLGEDITIDSDNAVCEGESITLDTGLPAAVHVWTKDGVEIAGETASTLLVTEAGEYAVDASLSGTCQSSDSIVIEFKLLPVANTPPNLEICSIEDVGEFTLTDNNAEVLGDQDPLDFEITYHLTEQDAIDNTSSLSSPYANETNIQTIFVRIADLTQQCFDTTSFELRFANLDINTALTPINECDENNDGFTSFILSDSNDEVLNGLDPTTVSISYHSTLEEANTNKSPLSSPYTNTSVENQTIFVRVQSNINVITDCVNITTLDLVVNATPTIVLDVDLRQCDIDTDGLSTFNLTEANALISANAANESFSFYKSLVDAENGINSIMDELNYPNTDSSANPDVLFVRVENSQACFRIAQLELFVSTSEIPTDFVIPDYEECDDARVDANITDGISVFDFSDATAQIENLFPIGQNITVTYFESIADALAEINPIADISNHINSASPFIQTITYRVDNNADNSCQGLGQFELKIINPTPRTDAQDLILCDDITVGDLSEEFDLTQNELFIYDGVTTLVATYFLSNEDALNNVVANQILTPSTYSNTNVTETIFVRVEDVNTNCFAVVDFDVTVNPLPDLVSVATILECENQTDGVFDFNLGQKRDEILNGKDSGEFIVSYHISQQDADDLINPQPDFFTNTVNPQQIFYAITNALTNCSNSSGSFFVEVLEGAQANSDGEPLDYELCDDNIDNDGVAQFDLNTLESEILDGQDPADYTITYHFSQSEALNNIAPLPFLYENLSNPQIIWARVSNNISPDICFEVQEIPLKVNAPPEFNLDDLYVLCITPNGTEVIPVLPILDTGLDMSRYTFEWFFNDTLIGGATRASYMPTEGGVYTVIVTDVTTSTSTFCSSSDSAEVIESAPPLISATVITDAFSDIHIIEVTAEGIGDYEYSLDGGPWQVELKFMDVSLGEHTITARDIEGCGESRYQVIVMDYPRFFTPNGDGYNDTWNISAINRQPSAKIFIFDRYGKMLKQLSPLGSGWNGTYNGNLLPSNDYWFVVEYNEPNTGDRKEFKAHFTLKR